MAILKSSTIDLAARFIFPLYRIIQWVVSPFIVLYFLRRGLKDRRYLRKFRERLGWLPNEWNSGAPGAPHAVWIHGVSVGEVMASLRLVDQLREQLPGAAIYLSCGTVAGRELAEQKAAARVDGIFFAPIDYCFAVRRALRTIRPRLVVVLETEIWPNLFREVKRSGAALVLANGRISDRALPRYQRIRRWLAPVLALPDAILTQSEEIAGRFRSIGAPASRVRAAGNLKYDFDAGAVPVPAAVAGLLTRLSPSHVWIAASTMPPADPGDPDEDDVVIDSFRRLAARWPGLLLILVPRRPERFAEAAAKLEASGIHWARRTRLPEDSGFRLPGILLLDTIGELAGLFRLADLVFMGGTFPHRGGHNVLEPAFFGKPVLAGPHMENFAAMEEEFDRAGAWRRVDTPQDLADAVDQLLRDPEERRQLGERAAELARRNQGVAQGLATELAERWRNVVPVARLSPARRLLLRPLAWLWHAGWFLKRRRALAGRRRLPAAVVSIGNLTTGGSGKTPFVAWLAGALKEAGIQPAILTRGYGRQSGEVLILGPGGAPRSRRETGDEAQIYLRQAVCPVGIGANRYVAGLGLWERFAPDVILLDDGMQHWQLYRDADIVLVDALDPLGGAALLPEGRLREPIDELRRASALVLTRAPGTGRLPAIEAILRSYQPDAPIYYARTRPLGWVEFQTGRKLPLDELPAGPAAAFCGLANPQSFWQTLRQLRLPLTLRRSFPDHHVYTAEEIAELRRDSGGARVFLTTEKDTANLAPGLAGDLPLYWLEITTAPDQPEDLLARIREILQARLDALPE